MPFNYHSGINPTPVFHTGLTCITTFRRFQTEVKSGADTPTPIL